jgi:tetratricopeptide (TPR) repeat protein
MQSAGGYIIAICSPLLLIVTVWKLWAELRLRRSNLLRIKVIRVSAADPTKIGVDPAPEQEILAGGTVPTYLPRKADAELRAAIEAARTGQGPSLVVVIGPSKVGKSRTLFEALRASDTEANELKLVAPSGAKALQAIIETGEILLPSRQPAVLWLDDLEPYLSAGITWSTVQDWQQGGNSRFVVATYSGRLAEPNKEMADLAGSLLAPASRINMAATTADELEPLRDKLSDDFETAREYGLAAYLVAGNRLESKLVTEESPEGAAVVRAAADWARCGRTDPLNAELLRRLWPRYVPAGVAATDAGFTAGLEWALIPVAGRIALLRPKDDGYRAYEYVVRLISTRIGAPAPPEDIWAPAIETASPTEAFQVGSAAIRFSRYMPAIEAFVRARESPVDIYAVGAGVNLGFLMSRLGRFDDTASAKGRDFPRAADSLFPSLGGYLDAHAISRPIFDRYRKDPDPALRFLAVRALMNLGVTYLSVGLFAKAKEYFDGAMADYGHDPLSFVRDTVSYAREQSQELGETLAATASHVLLDIPIIEAYGPAKADTDLAPDIARKLLIHGFQKGLLDKLPDALTDFRRVSERFEADPAPEMREIVAKAMTGQGFICAVVDLRDEAIARFERVEKDYGEDPAPEIREVVAKALVNRGAVLRSLGRTDAALAVFSQVINRYRQDSLPAMREHVLMAEALQCATTAGLVEVVAVQE